MLGCGQELGDSAQGSGRAARPSWGPLPPTSHLGRARSRAPTFPAAFVSQLPLGDPELQSGPRGLGLWTFVHQQCHLGTGCHSFPEPVCAHRPPGPHLSRRLVTGTSEPVSNPDTGSEGGRGWPSVGSGPTASPHRWETAARGRAVTSLRPPGSQLMMLASGGTRFSRQGGQCGRSPADGCPPPQEGFPAVCLGWRRALRSGHGSLARY